MKRKLDFLTIFLLMGILIFAPGADLGCIRKDKGKPITLVVWNLWDDTDSWKEMISSYVTYSAADQSRPTVKIQYYKKNIETYEKELADAFASGQGPDIFTIHNDWVPKYQNKIAPNDAGALAVKNYKRKFVDVASDDFVIDNKIYAIPLSLDTLALYYNEEIFKNAGIFDPPKTWDEFKEDVTRLTVLDEKNIIVRRAGAAIGADRNVNRASDILALLMLQSGSPIVDVENNAVVFSEMQKDKNDNRYSIGAMSLQFYTDFANPLKKIYTWNPTMDYSIDTFYQGRAAMMINYSYHIPTIISKAPKLKFAIGPMPQITGATMPVNYANYWAMSVFNGSIKQKESWDFLNYISNPEINKSYIQKIKKPVAQKDLVEWQEKGEDLNLAVFATQSLTAKSWRQIDSTANETIFNDAIKSVVLGRATPQEASDLASSQITETMKKQQ